MSADPNKFAKHVLWRLSSLEADMNELKVRLLEITALLRESPIPAQEIEGWQQRHAALRDSLYRVGLEDCGLPSEATPGAEGGQDPSDGPSQR